MTEKNKPMTEVEIWERCNKEPAPIMELVYEVIQLARLNTIPADRAIEVPDVGEWPDDMTVMCVELTDEHGKYWKHLKEIPRPVPVFVPGWYWVRTKIGGRTHPEFLNKFDPAYIIGPKIEEPVDTPSKER